MVKFSKVEIRDLFKAWLIISLAFGIVLSGGVFGWKLLENIILSAVTVGIAFLLHEMGHKFFAQKYGCFAEFRADNYMLFLAMITSFFGIVFAAPGAVVIMGRVTKAKYGRIALAGPMTNIVLAVALIGLSFVYSGEFYSKVISLGLLVNLWLAVFNMLPFWILDGKKIFTWNKQVYFATFAFIILLFIVKRFLPGILTVAQIIG